MEINVLHHYFLNSASVVIDTRKIVPNSIFFCLKGDRFDANTFASEALERGASYVVIDDSKYFIDHRTILVENTLVTLQKLASFHRNFLKLPIIALTGSNGKTTTKELIYAVLSEKYCVKATVGNLNNHIGVPLTLLSFDSATEIGIVEMGANHQKEIEFLCEITNPDFGYITNFGKAHLEGFGGFEGVIKGKSEMYHFLKIGNKKAFVNLDDSLQIAQSNQISAFTFSTKNKEADVYIQDFNAAPFVSLIYKEQYIQSHLVGIYNAVNIIAAITIGAFFNVEIDLIKKAIENYIPSNNRSQMSTKKSNKLILDAYNANPSSMQVALQNFNQLTDSNKIAFLGDMFELGTESYKEHEAILNSLKNQTESTFYFIGSDFFHVKKELDHFQFFATFEDLQHFLQKTTFENATILIKGSRGMALERIVELL